MIVLSRWDGEGAALRSAFQRAHGDTVLILSASVLLWDRAIRARAIATAITSSLAPVWR